MKTIFGTLTAVALVIGSGAAFAQTKAPDPVDAKFAALDADKSGSLEGKEADSLKAQLDRIDTNRDGKVSRQEYDVAVKTGLVK